MGGGLGRSLRRNASSCSSSLSAAASASPPPPMASMPEVVSARAAAAAPPLSPPPHASRGPPPAVAAPVPVRAAVRRRRAASPSRIRFCTAHTSSVRRLRTAFCLVCSCSSLWCSSAVRRASRRSCVISRNLEAFRRRARVKRRVRGRGRGRGVCRLPNSSLRAAWSGRGTPSTLGTAPPPPSACAADPPGWGYRVRVKIEW